MRLTLIFSELPCRPSYKIVKFNLLKLNVSTPTLSPPNMSSFQYKSSGPEPELHICVVKGFHLIGQPTRCLHYFRPNPIATKSKAPSEFFRASEFCWEGGVVRNVALKIMSCQMELRNHLVM